MNAFIPTPNQITQEKEFQLSKLFLNEITHSVGHDLRSPLFVIRSYAQLLKLNKDKQRLDRGLEMINEATTNMEGIINGLVQLIDFYTCPIPTFERIDFQQIFNQVRLQLCNEIMEHKPKFKIDFTDCPTIIFSSSYLKEIMTNLIDNAMRHNANKQDLVITIKTVKRGNQFQLNVIDNGKGVPNPKELAALKTPFYSNTDSQDRPGVGLSKIQAIAQRVNGSFKIVSPLGIEMTACKFIFPT